MQAYDTKYVIRPIINNKSVSVMAEWVKNLRPLKMMLLKIPNIIPIINEIDANFVKSPIIINIVSH